MTELDEIVRGKCLRYLLLLLLPSGTPVLVIVADCSLFQLVTISKNVLYRLYHLLQPLTGELSRDK